MKPHHSVRSHSKFSASGAERWFNCPGSVELSEGLPDKSSPWAEEGTQAHEVLESLMKCELSGNDGGDVEEAVEILRGKPSEMIGYAGEATKFITGLHYQLDGSECLVETRVYLDFIHDEMFGTFDGAVVDYFGTLHVFDYKYGAGHAVSPKENLQMIFYGIGLAHLYKWNFKRVRLWIIQPRIKGYNGPMFWEIPTAELYKYVGHFETAVKQVLEYPDLYVEGPWCHWCKAKSVCPEKTGKRLEKAIEIFSVKATNERKSNGFKKESKEKGRGEKASSEEKELESWYKAKARREQKSKSKEKSFEENDEDFF